MYVHVAVGGQAAFIYWPGTSKETEGETEGEAA